MVRLLLVLLVVYCGRLPPLDVRCNSKKTVTALRAASLRKPCKSRVGQLSPARGGRVVVGREAATGVADEVWGKLVLGKKDATTSAGGCCLELAWSDLVRRSSGACRRRFEEESCARITSSAGVSATADVFVRRTVRPCTKTEWKGKDRRGQDRTALFWSIPLVTRSVSRTICPTAGRTRPSTRRRRTGDDPPPKSLRRSCTCLLLITAVVSDGKGEQNKTEPRLRAASCTGQGDA